MTTRPLPASARGPGAAAGALPDPRALLDAVRSVRDGVVATAERTVARWRPSIRRREFLASATNLAHYLALRSGDLRPLQAALVPWGLSSLGRSESHVVASLDAVAATLAAVVGEAPDGWGGAAARPPMRAFGRGARRLERNADEVFGPARDGRRIRVMVTLAAPLADDPGTMDDLVRRGMDCGRINCAHDGPETWAALAARVRRASRAVGRPCRVAMDLGGPRVRVTGVTLPAAEHRVRRGDALVLAERHGGALAGAVTAGAEARIVCSVPDVVARLRPGARVLVDEGRLAAVVEAVRDGEAVLRVRHAPGKGMRLSPERGMNFPDTPLGIAALTGEDLRALDAVARDADLVGYSFVQEPSDVVALQRELRARRPAGAPLPPLLLKVETARALERLPALIVQAAGEQPVAVMIARGDLAVELGYERLAEVQEEILWLCEAAHIPVVWATQVLDRLVKKGTPTRAEITDAAMAERAECVMLNKGPYVAEAVSVLDDVLRRMQEHQRKKRPQLRALRVWRAESGVGAPGD